MTITDPNSYAITLHQTGKEGLSSHALPINTDTTVAVIDPDIVDEDTTATSTPTQLHALHELVKPIYSAVGPDIYDLELAEIEVSEHAGDEDILELLAQCGYQYLGITDEVGITPPAKGSRRLLVYPDPEDPNFVILVGSNSSPEPIAPIQPAINSGTSFYTRIFQNNAAI